MELDSLHIVLFETFKLSQIFQSPHYEYERLLACLHKLFGSEAIEKLLEVLEVLATLRPVLDSLVEKEPIHGMAGGVVSQLTNGVWNLIQVGRNEQYT